MAGEKTATAVGGTPTEEETENPLEEGGEGEAEQGAEGEEAAAAAAKKEEPASKPEGGKVPWYQRRINELTATSKRTAAENEALKAALKAKDVAVAKEDGEEEQAETPHLTEAEVERRANELAEKRAAKREFDAASNKIFDSGVLEFSKPVFQDALAELTEVTGGLTPIFVEALMETDHPQRVIMALAEDLDEAARILTLSPVRMAAAIAKVKPKEPKTEKKVSEAPAPLKPLGGRNAGGKSYDEMTEEEYAAARDAEIAKRQGRR